jgi:hypothetical protein
LCVDELVEDVLDVVVPVVVVVVLVDVGVGVGVVTGVGVGWWLLEPCVTATAGDADAAISTVSTTGPNTGRMRVTPCSLGPRDRDQVGPLTRDKP